jgi:myo-inositol-hexaphosphate 3-phosphohydrolase
MHDVYRDMVTVEDENGQREDYTVEALFEMKGRSYAMLKSDHSNHTIVMKVEEEGDDQYLVSIKNEEDVDSILDAYQVAVAGTEDLEVDRHL